jgi:hypothetical protein
MSSLSSFARRAKTGFPERRRKSKNANLHQTASSRRDVSHSENKSISGSSIQLMCVLR